jgi:hypothetical protein
VSERPHGRWREGRILALAFALLCCVAVGIAGHDLDLPGLYYDEVIQAEPAVQFLAEDGRPSGIPGARTIRLFGGWFPVMIQPYMGALKSQALIPVFAAFGPSATSLRLATLGLSLVGLLFTLLWTREVLGVRVAIVATALLAVDPSFLWIGRHDWGSFALGLICRCGGLTFLTTGWRQSSPARLFAGGLCLGLGLYNKIDFGVFIAAAALAGVAVLPRIVGDALRSRGLRPLPAVIGFLLGAGPMIAGAGAVFAATRSVVHRQAEVSGDWAEKLHTFATMLDGSYFHRLMLAGGSFERMFEFDGAAAGPFLGAFLACGVFLGASLWRDRRRGALDPAEAFVWLSTLALAIGIFLTPRTVRVHHTLNLYPFPQLVVAIALVRFGAAAASRPLRRVAAAAMLAAIVAGSLVVDFRTFESMRSSGGKGRWSNALADFAGELAGRPGSVTVSLDWGFHGPLRFAARDIALVEPIWKLRSSHLPGRAWSFAGTPRHVYLVFEDDLAVFDFGPKFLAMVRDMGPEDVNIRRHLDGEEDLAFLSLRFARDHRLRYDGAFTAELAPRVRQK